MSIITLTTDFGLKDHSVATVKGAILNILNNPTIVDISHLITPFNIIEAAYIIRNAYKSFPKGSIHIIGVDAEHTPENKHLAMELDDHFFICADNGIMSLVASQIKPAEIVEIDIHNSIQTSFTLLDVFVYVATHLAKGGKLDVIGRPVDNLKHLKYIQPQISDQEDQIIGHVVYIDNFGNLITNVTKHLFEKYQNGRKFTITARNIKFNKLYKSYSDAIDFSQMAANRQSSGKKIALFNSANFIELSLYKSNPQKSGGASSLFGIELMDTININFYE
jgi:S-adenosylmethionine hydrolase